MNNLQEKLDKIYTLAKSKIAMAICPSLDIKAEYKPILEKDYKEREAFSKLLCDFQKDQDETNFTEAVFKLLRKQ